MFVSMCLCVCVCVWVCMCVCRGPIRVNRELTLTLVRLASARPKVPVVVHKTKITDGL